MGKITLNGRNRTLKIFLDLNMASSDLAIQNTQCVLGDLVDIDEFGIGIGLAG